jgi:acyl-CoA thioester hydrolase
VGRASLTIEQQAVRRAAVDEASVVLAEGRIRIGCVDTQAWRPQRIPAEVLAALSS